jgi:hypothetical protein
MMYLIGNPTHDTLSINKKTVQALGGTVWYAALFLAGLGRRVAVVGIGDDKIKRRRCFFGGFPGSIYRIRQSYRSGSVCRDSRCPLDPGFRCIRPAFGS